MRDDETEHLMLHCIRCDHEWKVCRLPIIETLFVQALRRSASLGCPKCKTDASRIVLAGPRSSGLVEVAAVVNEAATRADVSAKELIDRLMPVLLHHGLLARAR